VGIPANPISFAYFDAPFQVFFAELAERALAQSEILLSSPGTIVTLEKEGRRYLYWRVYDAQGKRRDHYIGAESAPGTETALAGIQTRIATARQFADGSLALRKQGYAAADNSAALTLAALFNAGVFRQGAMFVGTHAFGAIVNALGVRLPANYYTEDIDLARYGAIQLAARPQGGLLELLECSGLPFAEVLELDVRKPSTTFRARGRKLRVALLVPGDMRYRTYRIPELGAHATGLPFFDYLLESPVPAVVLGRDHVIPVRVPNAARYCLHKLIVASLRAARSAAKADKDITQSTVLAAALTDKFEGDLQQAARAVPAGARKRLAQGARRAAALLGDRFPAARDFLEGLRSP
jgi:hypothetical protein